MSADVETFTRLPRLEMAGFLMTCRWPRVEHARADHELAAKLAVGLPDRGAVRNFRRPEDVRRAVEAVLARHLVTGWSVEGMAEADVDQVFDRLDAHYARARERAAQVATAQ